MDHLFLADTAKAPEARQATLKTVVQLVAREAGFLAQCAEQVGD